VLAKRDTASATFRMASYACDSRAAQAPDLARKEAVDPRRRTPYPAANGLDRVSLI
jgi:hypothetical protein